MKTARVNILAPAIAALVLSILFFAAGQDVFAQSLSIERMIRSLEWSNASEAKAAYNQLMAKGDKAVPYLIAALKDPFENTSVRVNCADILGKLKAKEAIPAIAEALNLNNKFRIRYTAAQALGNIGDSSALAALVNSLNDPDPTVRTHAVSAIREIGDKKGGPPLVSMLGDPDPSIRLLSAEVLVDFKTKEASPAFIQILQQQWDLGEIRILAAKGLGEIGGKDSTETLSNSLIRDPNDLVRAECAEALGKLGDRKAVPYLVKALNDEYRKVVINSVSSLSAITGKKLAVDADKWREWYKDNPVE